MINYSSFWIKIDKFLGKIANWLIYIIIAGIILYLLYSLYPYEAGKYQMYKDYYEKTNK
jgi:hypothetical protein